MYIASAISPSFRYDQSHSSLKGPAHTRLMNYDLPMLESARRQEYEPRNGYVFDHRRGLVRVSSDGSSGLDTVDLPEPVRKELMRHGLEVKEDGVVVWSENSPAHPKNWPVKRKLYDTAIIVFLEFFTYVCKI